MRRTLIGVVLMLSVLAGLVVAAPQQHAQAATTGPVWLNFTSEHCLRATGKNWAPVYVQAHVTPPGESSRTAKTAGTWVRVDGAFYYGRSEVDAVVWCKSPTWPYLPVPVTLAPAYRYFTGPHSYWI
jgi:hypothetical protein